MKYRTLIVSVRLWGTNQYNLIKIAWKSETLFTDFGDDHPRSQVKTIFAIIPLAQKRIKVRICVSAAMWILPKCIHAEQWI